MTGSKSLWQSWSTTTRFSIVAFVIAAALSVLSMGALGFALYYPVALALPYSIDQLQGDATWPSIIMAGMTWSLGFLWAGLILHYLKLKITKRWQSVLLYILILWLWDYIVWFTILTNA
jgi:hypothetical protein